MLVEEVREAGIVGNGGAGFPTHIKLNTRANYFIVNGAECEPLIETDKYLMRHRTKELVWGIEIIAAHLGATQKYIAVKAAYKQEIKTLKEEILRLKLDIQIYEMKSFYPSGDEQVIVHEITGKTVPVRGIPLEVGAVVDNVGTVISVYEAMIKEQPTTSKYLSVVGEVSNPLMLKVPIGTSIRGCIEQAMPLQEEYAIVMGGPMMGRIITDAKEIDAQVVTKTDGNILVLPINHYLIRKSKLSMKHAKMQSKSACIQCRLCTDLCPRKGLGQEVLPHQVMRNLYREYQIDTLEEYERAFGSAMNCSECGICELYACPMQLSPRKVNAYFKQQLGQKKICVIKKPLASVDTMRDYKKIPTEKLVGRIGLGKYYTHTRLDEVTMIYPKVVRIPLKQHIGLPCEPVVEVGDSVQEGDLIGKIPDGKIGANIHASISGVITDITDAITINTKE